MFRYWIFNPIPRIQTDKGRLKTDKILLTLPSPRFNGERIKVRDGVSGALAPEVCSKRGIKWFMRYYS